tara:strand:- start:180 stop:698 length:519 start_codon:yes stop_codon:yes gene_type:complete
MKLDDIKNTLNSSQANLIIINDKNDIKTINSENLIDNYLIISNSKNNDLSLNKNYNVFFSPTTISLIKNKVDNLIQNLKLHFHDISLDNEKITNLNNNYFCYLTKIELEILGYLIREREASKNFIKENILNIKSNIETNSLESHLTRIRKKMNKVKTNVKIQTKSEKLKIVV